MAHLEILHADKLAEAAEKPLARDLEAEGLT